MVTLNSCKYVLGWSTVAVSLCVCSGCGNSRTESTPPKSDQNATAQTKSSAPAGAATSARFQHPKDAVVAFLEALKSGDQKSATRILTKKAQEEMARTEASIQPPGSPSATFEVTDFEYIGEGQQGAHVFSRWTDVDPDGAKSSHEIVWILRQDQQDWAVAGFATRVFDDQDPLILNFEDPLDLQRKRSAVDEEIARRDKPAAPQQAKLPAKKVTR